ncbi:hemolysin family protein [Paenibacillus macerans]|uniref:hemolysin family protein n=1 Tax=Paenibacillus macerans TaxID=44252 RepID=UPI003D31DF32
MFEILIILILILINAFFAASEIALISLNDNKMKAMALQGHRKAKVIVGLLGEPSKFLATIQIGITLAGFFASAFAGESFAGELAAYLTGIGVPIPPNALSTISLVVITLLLSYFQLVLGELVPKRVAMKKAEAMAMFAATTLSVLSKVTAPFVKLLTASTNLLVRLFGIDPNANDEEVSEEEIRMMLDTGAEMGTIQPSEKLMINNIFDFDNLTVSDIMTHRIDVVAIPVDADQHTVAEIADKEQYTRFPVYEDTVDNLIGILHSKDLIRYLRNGEQENWNLQELATPPYFIPVSKKTNELFEEMQQNRIHMAIVVDEYGGTAGIVTMEDLLEEIVGNIYDEHDEKELEFERIGEDSYLFSGTMSLDDAQDVLGISLPLEDFDTLSGFMIGQLKRIPTIHEKPEFEYGGYVFAVREVGQHRIRKLAVAKKNDTPVLRDAVQEG